MGKPHSHPSSSSPTLCTHSGATSAPREHSQGTRGHPWWDPAWERPQVPCGQAEQAGPTQGCSRASPLGTGSCGMQGWKCPGQEGTRTGREAGRRLSDVLGSLWREVVEMQGGREELQPPPLTPGHFCLLGCSSSRRPAPSSDGMGILLENGAARGNSPGFGVSPSHPSGAPGFGASRGMGSARRCRAVPGSEGGSPSPFCGSRVNLSRTNRGGRLR